jgi:hypothetical protein
MALALEGQSDAKIIAVDTHITDLRSASPYEDGTIMKFLRHLQHYKAMSRVVPMLMPTGSVLQVLSKRCANLVVVQAPVYHGDLSAIGQGVSVAMDAVRRGGKIAVCRPRTPALNFSSFVAGCLPGAEFNQVLDHPGIVVYEYTKKGG